MKPFFEKVPLSYFENFPAPSRFISIPTAIQPVVHKPNTDFGRFPKLASTQHFLVFSIPLGGALHEYGWFHVRIVEEIILVDI